MNVNKIKAEIARLIIKRDGLMQGGPGIHVPDSLSAEYKKLERDIAGLGAKAMADPACWSEMETWMVDIVGSGGCLTEETVARFVDDPSDTIRDIQDRSGVLASQVRNFLERSGYNITDSGFGAGSWHLGVPCNDQDRITLCARLHLTFCVAIRSGLIDVYCKWWGYKMRGIRNVLDARKWLEEHGEKEEGDE